MGPSRKQITNKITLTPGVQKQALIRPPSSRSSPDPGRLSNDSFPFCWESTQPKKVSSVTIILFMNPNTTLPISSCHLLYHLPFTFCLRTIYLLYLLPTYYLTTTYLPPTTYLLPVPQPTYYSPTYLRTHPILTHLLAYPLTTHYSPTHRPTYPPIHPLTWPPAHLPTCPTTHLTICPNTHLPTHSPTHLLNLQAAASAADLQNLRT
jgi:hypothetical protein